MPLMDRKVEEINRRGMLFRDPPACASESAIVNVTITGQQYCGDAGPNDACRDSQMPGGRMSIYKGDRSSLFNSCTTLLLIRRVTRPTQESQWNEYVE
jgi:hypothetical protein